MVKRKKENFQNTPSNQPIYQRWPSKKSNGVPEKLGRAIEGGRVGLRHGQVLSVRLEFWLVTRWSVFWPRRDPVHIRSSSRRAATDRIRRRTSRNRRHLPLLLRPCLWRALLSSSTLGGHAPAAIPPIPPPPPPIGTLFTRTVSNTVTTSTATAATKMTPSRSAGVAPSTLAISAIASLSRYAHLLFFLSPPIFVFRYAKFGLSLDRWNMYAWR